MSEHKCEPRQLQADEEDGLFVSFVNEFAHGDECVDGYIDSALVFAKGDMPDVIASAGKVLQRMIGDDAGHFTLGSVYEHCAVCGSKIWHVQGGESINPPRADREVGLHN